MATDGPGKAPGDSTRFYAAVSIAAALATVGLKAAAYLLTGSVGLPSDAATPRPSSSPAPWMGLWPGRGVHRGDGSRPSRSPDYGLPSRR